MECGPADKAERRKWIMDIDGSLADLRAHGFLREDEPCVEEVSPCAWALCAPHDAGARSTGSASTPWSWSSLPRSRARCTRSATSCLGPATLPSRRGAAFLVLCRKVP